MKKVKENYVRKALFFCKLALTLLLLFMLARMFLILGGNSVVFTPASVSAAENITDAIETESSCNLQDYTAIISHNIFGISDTANDAANNGYRETAGPLDEQLGIALLGTLAGSPTISRAIIKDLKTNSIGLYKIGDTVATATIENVEKECIVLSDHGLRKTLCLGIETQNTGLQGGRVSAGLPTKQEMTENQPGPVALRAAANQASDSVIESILTDVVIEPHRVNDEVDGLKISGLDNVPAAKALGLQDGDIIQVVNGQNVTSKQQAFQILKKAGAQDSIDIELLRNNKIKTLFFPLTDMRQR
ncbi:MAG: type II secretion system protein N [Planctomycetota bacterium]